MELLRKTKYGRDPLERLTGSLSFGAVARIVLLASRHQEEGEKDRTIRLLLRAKSNIGPDDGGLENDLIQEEIEAYPGIIASSVQWVTGIEPYIVQGKSRGNS